MVIAISSNRKGGGKDEVAKMICYILSQEQPHYSVYKIYSNHIDFNLTTPKIFKFAERLKKGCAAMFGEDERLWEEDKDTLFIDGYTRRDVLNKFAKVARDFHDNIFAKSVLEEDNIVVSDFRFLNEAEFLKQKKAIFLRVERPDYCYVSNMQEVKPERSWVDTQLDDFEHDWIIYNNGTLEMLYDKVKGILLKYNLK